MNKPQDGRLDPRRLDLSRFVDDASTLAGHWPLADLPRLVADAAPAGDGLAAWSAQGERRAVSGSAAEPWLHLTAHAVVRLTCQRCLQAVDVALDVSQSFRFVADEAAAERLDEASDEADVLALPPKGRVDLQQLLEDELILALPLVPRHEVCPEPLPMPVDDEPELAAEHPFAALAALKQRKS